MPDQLLFAIEVTLNGLMTGVMYSLVALGFVLIFKASGVFNYAQGVMALFAALTLVGIQSGQVPFAHLVNAVFGTTIALIEHDMGVVMDISDRVVVLDYGRKIGDGTPDEVRRNPDVIAAYLGVSH